MSAWLLSSNPKLASEEDTTRKCNSIGLTFDKTMESATKKLKSSVEDTSRDRLSELPDGVLVNILSFMPTLDAVRTVLIRRFGNLWTMVHSCFSEPKGTKHPTSVSFSDFVSGVLFLHRRPTIEKFHLDVKKPLPMIEMWLRFAQSKEAKALKVKICGINYYTLPRCVFAGQSLVSLKIAGFKIEYQSRVHVGSLRKLELRLCRMRDDTLKELISGCPSLEELEISNPFNSELNKLCITSPIIKRIQLEGLGNLKLECPNLKMLGIFAKMDLLGVIDISSVSKVCMDLYGSPSQQSANTLLSLLKKVGNAEVLELSGDTMEHLAYCSLKRLAIPHNRWKRLNIDLSYHKARVQGVCSFVRNSPSLEELTINVDTYEESVSSWDPIFDNNLFSQELSSACVMPQLRTITMYGLGWAWEIYEQLRLAKFLLKSAVNLEKFLFVSKFDEQITVSANQSAFFKQLTGFQRASANASTKPQKRWTGRWVVSICGVATNLASNFMRNIFDSQC